MSFGSRRRDHPVVDRGGSAAGRRGGALPAAGRRRQRGGGCSRRVRRWPVDLLDPQPGEQTSTSAAAAETKRCKSARGSPATARLTCLERDPRKSAALRRRLERAGVAAAIVTGDATGSCCRPSRRFDRVLVDAPCSGIGIVGRHPEARWKKRATDGERLAMTQRALLEQRGASRSRRRRAALRRLLERSARDERSGGVVARAARVRARHDSGGLRSVCDRRAATSRASRNRRSRRLFLRAIGARR